MYLMLFEANDSLLILLKKVYVFLSLLFNDNIKSTVTL